MARFGGQRSRSRPFLIYRTTTINQELIMMSWWLFTLLKVCTEIRVPKVPFHFFISWNTKLERKFWFSFLYWSWDIKNQTKWFLDFQNNWELKFKFEVRFSFFILIWKTKNQIYLNKYLMKLVTIPLTQSQ